MSLGESITGFMNVTHDAEGNFSDRHDSEEDSSDEEQKPGLFGSIFGFWGFGGKKNNANDNSETNNNKLTSSINNNQANTPYSDNNKNLHVVKIKTLKQNGVEVGKTRTTHTFKLNSFPLFQPNEIDVMSKTRNNNDNTISELSESMTSEYSVKIPHKDSLKLKLKGGPTDYVIKPNKQHTPADNLKTRLF